MDLPKTKRIARTYKVPAKDWPDGPKELTLVELTPDEELLALARAAGRPGARTQELVKQCVVGADAAVLSPADSSVDELWGKMPSRVRELVTAAYQRIHLPKEEEVDDFLATEKATVLER